MSHLRGVGGDGDAEMAQCEFGEGASHAACYGDTRRGASASTVVAYAVLLVISIVGMRRAEELAHVIVVGGVLIGVSHHEAYGASSGFAFEDATEEFDAVGLLA